jgi:hypothetical protein
MGKAWRLAGWAGVGIRSFPSKSLGTGDISHPVGAHHCDDVYPALRAGLRDRRAFGPLEFYRTKVHNRLSASSPALSNSSWRASKSRGPVLATIGLTWRRTARRTHPARGRRCRRYCFRWRGSRHWHNAYSYAAPALSGSCIRRSAKPSTGAASQAEGNNRIWCWLKLESAVTRLSFLICLVDNSNFDCHGSSSPCTDIHIKTNRALSAPSGTEGRTRRSTI